MSDTVRIGGKEVKVFDATTLSFQLGESNLLCRTLRTPMAQPPWLTPDMVTYVETRVSKLANEKPDLIKTADDLKTVVAIALLEACGVFPKPEHP